MELYSRQAVLMGREHLETKEETRRAVKAEIHAVSKELSIIRRESKDIRALLTRSGVMEQQVEAERIARMRKTWREYDLPPEKRHTIECDAPDRYQLPEDGTVTNVSNIRKDGRNDR